jgi:hypothetical protein
MTSFLHDVVPVIATAAAIVSGTVSIVIALSSARLEHRNLCGIDVKDRLDLLEEVEKRLDRDSFHAWRHKDAEPPKDVIEEQLVKNLLVSRVFGRPITWLEWHAIRRFLAEQDNIGIDLLRQAWPFREKDTTTVRFRMKRRTKLRRLAYASFSMISGLSAFFGLLLIWFASTTVQASGCFL